MSNCAGISAQISGNEDMMNGLRFFSTLLLFAATCYSALGSADLNQWFVHSLSSQLWLIITITLITVINMILRNYNW